MRRGLFAVWAVRVAIAAASCLVLLSSARANQFLPAGSTEEQVEKALGRPNGKIASRKVSVWLYGNTEVSFENGKTTSDTRVPGSPQVQPSAVKPVEPVKTEKLPEVKNMEPVVASESKQSSALASLCEKLKDLKPSWSSTEGEKKSTISCSFGLPVLTPAAREAYKSKGKVPFRITAFAAVWVPPADGKKGKWDLARSGYCLIRLFDDAGAEVLNVQVSVDKMCPS